MFKKGIKLRIPPYGVCVIEDYTLNGDYVVRRWDSDERFYLSKSEVENRKVKQEAEVVKMKVNVYVNYETQEVLSEAAYEEKREEVLSSCRDDSYTFQQFVDEYNVDASILTDEISRKDTLSDWNEYIENRIQEDMGEWECVEIDV